MTLFLLSLAVAIVGIGAIEFGQARRPRIQPVVWSDDVERRRLRIDTRRDEW